jgi:hypothetical protein
VKKVTASERDDYGGDGRHHAERDDYCKGEGVCTGCFEPQPGAGAAELMFSRQRDLAAGDKLALIVSSGETLFLGRFPEDDLS